MHLEVEAARGKRGMEYTIKERHLPEGYWKRKNAAEDPVLFKAYLEATPTIHRVGGRRLAGKLAQLFEAHRRTEWERKAPVGIAYTQINTKKPETRRNFNDTTDQALKRMKPSTLEYSVFSNHSLARYQK